MNIDLARIPTNRVVSILNQAKLAQEKLEYEGSLSDFFKAAWSSIESSEYIDNWAIDAMAEHLEAVTYGQIRRLLINISPRCGKTNLTSICWPAWVWAQRNKTYLSGPQVRFMCGSYNDKLTLTNSNKVRRLILSPFYQKYWGDRFELTEDQNTKSKFDTTKGGGMIATSVRGTLLGVGGDVICVDDPHNTEDVESEIERETAERWWKELSSTRMNNPKLSPIVVNMQRLHTKDISGLILDSDEEFVHLMIPMRFDERRKCVTVVLPRDQVDEFGNSIPEDDQYKWEDPREIPGELMWPERFDEKEVKRIETRLGPMMCTPPESPVLMADLSMKPISEVEIGDDVIGFNNSTGREFNAKAKYRNRKLQSTKVVNMYSYIAPVVKITLDSGNVIRCTDNHKWYVGKKGGRRGYFSDGRPDIRPLYKEASVGSELMRVCPASLPVLSIEDERRAGWLSGFFDGEGTVALCAKNGPNYRKSSTIRFFQGAGRNRPLCDILEENLKHFGFDYKYREVIRSDRNVNISDHKNRIYTLEGHSGVPLYQKFLHIVKPHKWVDRIIQGAYSANWIQSKERVVSIEPDGIETVYALETETGNYIVWGFASSNSSGRLQQTPTPAGGAILKREWWQEWGKDEAAKYGLMWDENKGGIKEFPDFEIKIASLDTAFSEKEENDYSALTVWGIWSDKNHNPRAMLVYAWQRRLPLHGTEVSKRFGEAMVNFEQRRRSSQGLVEAVAEVCKKYKVNRLLIENKSRGLDVANEIRRLYSRENWGLQLINPIRDKVTRAHSIVPVFADGVVWAPDLSWADEVITQCELFPKDDHDDLVDTVTMAIGWLRDNGIIVRGDEVEASIEEEMAYRPQARTVAEMYNV